MFQFHNNFIGYQDRQFFESFSGSDSIELFNKNLKSKPDDWYYRTHPIEYQRNSLGHRSKEISEIDLDNYILTTGCSHTEGMGLSVNHTYSHVLGEKFKCDYYNLGLSGMGISTMMHNLTVWFSTVKQLPKFVVMQFPDTSRFNLIEDEQDARNISSEYARISPWAVNTPGMNTHHKKFLVSGDAIKYFDSTVTFARVLANSLIKVPIIEVHISLPYDMPNQLFFKDFDEARDGHRGIKSNYLLAGDISKTYKEMID